jgi:branched-chain amino acid transport system ATP-binding protein
VIYFPKGIAVWLRRWYAPLLDRLPGFKPIRTDVGIAPSTLMATDASDVGKGKNDSPIFRVDQLHKHFGGLAAVRNVSFHINRGEIVGLIGPNGAGKTTVFNLITGFISPDSGVIEFRGERITGLKPPHKVCLKHIGRTFQVVKPFKEMTVVENVMLGTFSNVRGIKQAREEALSLIDSIGLSGHRNHLASSLTIPDRKRLELGRALATHPHLLLLDEVMAGLNPKETEEVIKVIQEISNQGVTLLVIEHVMKAIMTLSDRIIVLHHGEKISEGTPVDISKDKIVIDAYLGKEYLA